MSGVICSSLSLLAAVGFVAHVCRLCGFSPLSSVNVEADDEVVVSTSRKKVMGDLAKWVV